MMRKGENFFHIIPVSPTWKSCNEYMQSWHIWKQCAKYNFKCNSKLMNIWPKLYIYIYNAYDFAYLEFV